MATCAHCGQTYGLFRCSRCKAAFFCSKEHQRLAWPAHKERCGSPTSVPTDASVQLARVSDAHGLCIGAAGWFDRSVFPPGLRFEDAVSHLPSEGPTDNILVLFHGHGDTAAAFGGFAKAIALPCTATVALGGVLSLEPVVTGLSWFAMYDDNWEPIDSSRQSAALALR